MRKMLLILQLLGGISTVFGFTSRIRGRPSPTSVSSSSLSASVEKSAPSISGVNPVAKLLHSAGYGKRLITLNRNNLDSTIVEVFVNGQAVLARMTDIVTSNDPQYPRIVVDLFSTDGSGNFDQQTIDLGQLISVWPHMDSSEQANIEKLYPKAIELASRYQSNAAALDKLLDKVYAQYVRKGRKNTKNSLPKKDELIAPIAKRLQKAGPGYARLLDSSLLADFLSAKNHPIMSRMVASMLLAYEAKEGGRFKRWPSLLVNHNDQHEWTIVNGGWLVVDQNVRAGAEARKLVERSTNPERKTKNASDDRIIQRLECLAMGEVLDEQELKLEKDVRETLRMMDLPFTSDGASQALVQIGRWTPSTQSKLKQAVQPWSADVLEAASWYAGLDWQEWGDENRIDLRNLPSVCVDAKSTSFRDDAMSVRPRARTGRWTDEDASKWEILIHITDMSDIYVPLRGTIPDEKGYLATLQEAAKHRGVSRYDLPLGPLHLLPPTVLQTLSFSSTSPHRCLTMWVYIDERDGRILDAGFERSIVAPPSQISYSDASKLIDTSGNELPKELARIRTILLLVERNLKLWKSRRVSKSEVARKREDRLASRAAVVSDEDSDDVDDGRAGFRRTRGHQLVDMCLDMYSYTGRRLLQQAKAPIPIARGADASRGGRMATAPLRRYIDGQCQRQLLAVLCSHGDAMSHSECREVGKIANNARNAVVNVRAGR